MNITRDTAIQKNNVRKHSGRHCIWICTSVSRKTSRSVAGLVARQNSPFNIYQQLEAQKISIVRIEGFCNGVLEGFLNLEILFKEPEHHADMNRDTDRNTSCAQLPKPK